MKKIATLLLIVVAMLYIFARWMEPQGTVWAYVSAFAEAGMVGAIADWFAITALFRHPLGIPIPHTAIIPANRNRIAQRLADFLCNKFINTEQIAQHLGLGDPTRIFARWLNQPVNARKTAGHICSGIEHLLPLLQSERLKHYIRQKMCEAIQSANLADTSSEILNIVAQEGQHQRILDDAALRLGRLITDEEIREHIANAVANEIRLLRYIGLDAAAGRYATRKIIASVATLLEDISKEPQHPFRKRFDHYVRELINELKSDPDYQERLKNFQQTLTRQPTFIHALDQAWDSLLQWLKEDCLKPFPITQNHIEQALQTIARQLQENSQTRQWINSKIFKLIPQAITRYRATIHHYIVDTVNAWTPKEMTQGIEKYIGKDLQFIRINGTLVGGLVGLSIHAINQLIAYLQ